jgi:hypothetical protein
MLVLGVLIGASLAVVSPSRPTRVVASATLPVTVPPGVPGDDEAAGSAGAAEPHGRPAESGGGDSSGTDTAVAGRGSGGTASAGSAGAGGTGSGGAGGSGSGGSGGGSGSTGGDGSDSTGGEKENNGKAKGHFDGKGNNG